MHKAATGLETLWCNRKGNALGAGKVQAHTKHTFCLLPRWDSGLEAASLLHLHPSPHPPSPAHGHRASSGDRWAAQEPSPTQFNPWWLLIVNYTETTEALMQRGTLGKKWNMTLPQSENANIKARKTSSKDQSSPCTCPHASLPPRISALPALIPYQHFYPLLLLSSPAAGQWSTTWSTKYSYSAAGAFTENMNDSHQGLENASCTEKSRF